MGIPVPKQARAEVEDKPTTKTVHIPENATGYSYKSLFGIYFKNATSIRLADPYIRLEFQIRNLLAFIGIIDTVDGPVTLHLTTSAEDPYQKRSVSQKLDEIAENLKDSGITFTYEFSDTIHRRGIELDNGWMSLDLMVPAAHDGAQAVGALTVRADAPGPVPLAFTSAGATLADGTVLPVAVSDGALFVSGTEEDGG